MIYRRVSHTVLAPCSRDPAGNFHSADDGSRGAALALGHLPAHGGVARRPTGALLLAKGTSDAGPSAFPRLKVDEADTA